MRIVVMGAGGVGAYLGGRLLEAGHEVTLVARGAHLAAIQANGLRIVGDEEAGPLAIRAVGTPAEAGPADLVLFAVKTYDLDGAAAAIAPSLGPETMLLSLQNGVEAPERLAGICGAEHVLAGSIYIVSGIGAPGVIEKVGKGFRIDLGELSGQVTERSEAAAAALREAGGVVQVVADTRRLQWEKFLVLCALSTVTSAAMETLGAIRSDAEGTALLQRAIRETGAVGKALGVGLDDEAIEAAAGRIFLAPDATKSSMQRDYERKRKVELEQITGAVVRLGRQVGVATPTYDALYPLLRVRAQQFGGLE